MIVGAFLITATLLARELSFNKRATVLCATWRRYERAAIWRSFGVSFPRMIALASTSATASEWLTVAADSEVFDRKYVANGS